LIDWRFTPRPRGGARYGQSTLAPDRQAAFAVTLSRGQAQAFQPNRNDHSWRNLRLQPWAAVALQRVPLSRFQDRRVPADRGPGTRQAGQPDQRRQGGQRGRFVAGSMDKVEERPNGALYRLDPDLSLHKAASSSPTVRAGVPTDAPSISPTVGRAKSGPTTTTSTRVPCPTSSRSAKSIVRGAPPPTAHPAGWRPSPA
jgi:hypothetical protein